MTLTINGKEVKVPPGTLVIEAAKQAGIEIPSYCYYPGLTLQGACRMCLVAIEKMPKLQTACTTVVANGMVVLTETEEVKNARKAMLEFLLTNHPARLPRLRQGRRVRTSGRGVPLRRGGNALHGIQAAP